MRVIFFGTPRFSAEILIDLVKHDVDIVAIVTKPDKPQGRSAALVPTPVKQAAQAYAPNLTVYQPEIVSVPEFAPTLEHYQADLFVVVAYGEIIKQHLLDMPKVGCINLHTSLLPKYRGAAPIQQCLINGETETGVTVMHMVKKMDAGDIIRTIKVPIGPNTTFGELENSLLQAGSEALLMTIKDFEKGIFQRIPQDHTQATFASKIELEDCQIDWKKSAQSIHNLVRGVNPYPGAWCYVNIRGQKKRLKIFKTRMVESKEGTPGQILPAKELTVFCGKDALCLQEVQLEGKKVMSTEELLRGIPPEAWDFTTVA